MPIIRKDKKKKTTRYKGREIPLGTTAEERGEVPKKEIKIPTFTRSMGGRLSGKDREELAQARARRAGIFDESRDFPTLEGDKITTKKEITREGLLEVLKFNPEALEYGEDIVGIEGSTLTIDGKVVTIEDLEDLKEAPEEPQKETLEERRARGSEWEIFKEQLPSTPGELVTDIIQATGMRYANVALINSGRQKIIVGGISYYNALKAARAAQQAQWTAKTAPAVKTLSTNFFKSPLGISAQIAGVPWAIEKIGSSTWNAKAGDQQTALNTLGMIAPTIAADGMSPAGDSSAAMRELLYLRKTILQLEDDIQGRKISSVLLKFNGKVIDINADTYDQLNVLNENIRKLRSFMITDMFPEASPLEIQNILREAEAEGLIEAVDISMEEARRPTSGAETEVFG